MDEGDEDDRSDLEALISVVADDGSPFSKRVDALADLEEVTRMWAVEKYAGHWDGYAGASTALLPSIGLPSNYYLFSDPTGEFKMLPWGTDQTWGHALTPPPGRIRPFPGRVRVSGDFVSVCETKSPIQIESSEESPVDSTAWSRPGSSTTPG